MSNDAAVLLGILVVIGWVIIVSACFRSVGLLTEIKKLLEALRSDHARRLEEQKVPPIPPTKRGVHVLQPLAADEKRRLYGQK
jgi:hypothetical protein